jgi:hypothetical protein
MVHDERSLAGKNKAFLACSGIYNLRRRNERSILLPEG